MPLSGFVKTFSLPDNFKKGDFPHLFNKPVNHSYSGLYPEKLFYGYEKFFSHKKIEFDKWYESVINNTFNFKDHIRDFNRGLFGF